MRLFFLASKSRAFLRVLQKTAVTEGSGTGQSKGVVVPIGRDVAVASSKTSYSGSSVTYDTVGLSEGARLPSPSVSVSIERKPEN